jgi:DNA replication and repair protein RecF
LTILSDLKEGSENLATTVESVRLQDFRNYVALETSFSPGLNVLTGQNAQGKTNLLEALYLLATGRLLRGQRDMEAIREGASSARVEVKIAPFEASLAVQLQAGIKKRSFLNGYGLPRASDLLGRLPAVCVSAEDLSLTRGEPADRRLFLDLELSALHSTYLRDLTVYKRALEHRNALLRQAAEHAVADSHFEPWEAQIALHGAALRRARAEYVLSLATIAQDLHGIIAAGEALSLTYIARDTVKSEAEFIEELATRRGNDISRGSTSLGPHRDEVAIVAGGRDARLYGSQGQQRAATISIKLAALKVAQAQRGFPPLLLLDDVFSDLDSARREALVDLILGIAGQVVLTCTEASAAGDRVLESARIFAVAGGTVTQL